MLCKNCGTQNVEGAKFCVKCGNTLEEISQINASVQNSESTVINQAGVSADVQNQNNVNSAPVINTTTQSTVEIQNNVNVNNVKKDSIFRGYWNVIRTIILKPFTGLKEEIGKFNEIKDSAIFALIVSAVALVLSFIKSVISVVRVKSLWGNETSWVWENIKELDFVKVFFVNFLVYAGIIAAIAGLYYLGSLIVKKKSNFSRLLAIATISIIPMYVCNLLLAPILGMITSFFAISFTVIGLIYSLLLMVELMSNELELNGNVKFYFNLACISILLIVGIYVCINLLVSAINSSLGGLTNMF